MFFFNRYKRTVGPIHSWSVVLACWIFAIPLGFTPMFGWNNINASSQRGNETKVCRFIDVIPMSYLVYFNFLLCTLLPLFVMTVIYGYIFCTIRGSLREKPGNIAQSKSDDYLKKEKQLAGSLSLVLALFALSWLPLHLMNSIVYFGKGEDVPLKAFYIGILLSHANSAINPVVYAFKLPKIKTSYVKFWKRYIAS